MNLAGAMESLVWIGSYFLVATLLSYAVVYLVVPRSRQAKGPLYHPNGILHFISWGLEGIRPVSIGRRDTAVVVIVLSLLTLQVAVLPLFSFSGNQIFYHLPGMAFLLLYFICRLVWTLFLNRRENSPAPGRRDPVAVAAVALLVTFGSLSFAKGGRPIFIFDDATPMLWTKPSCVLLFFLLYFFSSHFFLSAESAVGFVRWPCYVSRLVWFFVLPWMFSGPVFSGFAANYLFFLLLSVVLNVGYEVVAVTFPDIGSRLRIEVDERFLLPAVVTGSLLIHMEVLFF